MVVENSVCLAKPNMPVKSVTRLCVHACSFGAFRFKCNTLVMQGMFYFIFAIHVQYWTFDGLHLLDSVQHNFTCIPFTPCML